MKAFVSTVLGQTEDVWTQLFQARGSTYREPRLVTFFRLPLAIPAYVFATVLTTVAQVLALIGWFVGLAVGRMPKGMRDLSAYCLRYGSQTYAYVFLLTSRYPSLASGRGFQFEEA